MSDLEAVAVLRDTPGDVLAAVHDLVHGNRPPWHSQAACRGQGTAAWFPGKGDTARDALAACARCPVADECRDAGKHEKFGIWGGITAGARRHRRAVA